jgi:predicted secreted protein
MAQAVQINDMSPHTGSMTVTKCSTSQPPPVTVCEKKEIVCQEKPVSCSPCRGPICHFKPINWCLAIIWFIVIALIVWFVLYLIRPEFILRRRLREEEEEVAVAGRRRGRFDDFDWGRMILATLVITALLMVFIYLWTGCNPF